MSVDEDTELRDLVAQTLESNGVLGKIRAQLRANVFLTLEEQDSAKNKQPYANPSLKKFIGTKEGLAITSLVREFLQFFDLDYTLAVFDPETGLGDNYENRVNLAREYNIIEASDSDSKKAPLLAEVVKRGAGGPAVVRGRTSSTTSDGSEYIFIPKDLGLKHLQEARHKFDTYDKDKNGTIDKDELRALFTDMFPSFHKNMLERYVNDEFRAVDKDFSNTIDFEEFLDMYKRLFVLCKSVVSHDVSDITMASPRRMSDTPPVASKIPAPLKKSNSQEKNRLGKLANIDEKGGPKGLTDALSDQDDDSFFDDPLPDNSKTKETSGDVKADKVSRVSHIPVRSPNPDQRSTKKADTKPGGTSGMSSLAGLPSLTGSGGSQNESTTPRMPDVGTDELGDRDKRLSDFDFDGGDDYDEDFESSNISPMGATPRSARSDHNLKSIEDDDIEEDIQEEISIVDDFLKSDNSGMDDLTTDRTVSPTDQSAAFDYVEEVLS